MKEEKLTGSSKRLADRVMNWLIWGNPEGRVDWKELHDKKYKKIYEQPRKSN